MTAICPDCSNTYTPPECWSCDGQESDCQPSVEELKTQWRNDPIWDLEETEGFEAHYEELLAYRLACKAEWKAQRARELEDKATALGVPGNLLLAQHFMELEEKILRLEEKVTT